MEAAINKETFPVDVSIVRGQVKVLHVSKGAVKSSPEIEYSINLPPQYKRIIGNIHENSTLRNFAEGTTQFIGVSDGSVKHGKGSAGYTILTLDKEESKFNASISVDSLSGTITLYRTKLVGILGILLAIETILAYSTLADISGNIYCDNKRAGKRVNKLQADYPTTIWKVLETEHKLLSEINKVRRRITNNINVAWVKGHIKIQRA